jgi:hypothetical protein
VTSGEEVLGCLNKVRGVYSLIDAARTFVERVERGEVRSVRTYNAFKDALALIDGKEEVQSEV